MPNRTHGRPASRAARRAGLNNKRVHGHGPTRRQGRNRRGQFQALHGQWRKPTYRSWENMLARCLNPKHVSYRYYGAKGVMVCPRWRRSFKDFLADMGTRKRGTSIDRIDPHGDYEPGNCRWASPRQQQQNRRANHRNGRNGHFAVRKAA